MHQSYKKWLESGKTKIFCSCKCGNEIIIKKSHKWGNGIPKFIHGHQNKGINNPNLGRIRLDFRGKNNPSVKNPKIGVKNPFYGKHHSEESLEKISNASKNRKQSQETITKRVEKLYGQKRTEEQKDKIRGDKNPSKRPEVREKISKIKTGKKLTPWSEERRMKISGKNSPNWRSGTSFLPYCSKFNEKKKEEIREQYGRKCIACGKLESEQMKEQKERGKKVFRLDVHHIDNDKEQGCNGKPWKLLPLCKICHAKILFNKMSIIFSLIS